MNNATAITCLFLDIGGVLLTNGWDHQARKRAAAHFKLEWDEEEVLHHLMFAAYEEGKTHAGGIPEPGGFLRGATVHTGSVPGIHVRAVAPLS